MKFLACVCVCVCVVAVAVAVCDEFVCALYNLFSTSSFSLLCYAILYFAVIFHIILYPIHHLLYPALSYMYSAYSVGVVEQPGDAFNPPQVALVMPFMSNGSLQDICYRNSPTFMSRLTNEMKIKFCHQAAKGEHFFVK